MSAFGIEIPSVEHPDLLAVVIEEAMLRGITVTRVSQGSGARLLTDAELGEMLDLAHEHEVTVYLFSSSRNSFEPLPDTLGGDQLRGEGALSDAVAELHRCATRGVDGMLVADVGLLALAGEHRAAGRLGALALKTSAAMAPLNSASAAVYERLGATSINVSAASSLEDLKSIRECLGADTTMDVYVESSDALGGGLRYRDAARFVEELAPVTLKMGLRNATSLYPYGAQLRNYAENTMREKVRRAEILLEQLRRDGITTAPRAELTKSAANKA